MAIAIIPARGGSKRIPKKNIKDFHGQPMISWAINAAQDSGLFEDIIVSTDSEDIADVAKQSGAICPFVRPADLSDDNTAMQPVIAHAISACAIDKTTPICAILPTAPFLRAEDLIKSYEAWNETKAEFFVSLATFAYPPQRALIQNQNGYLSLINEDVALTRSQDLPEAYHDAGQFYWGKADSWLEAKNILSHNSQGYLLSRGSVQDIDTPEDWAFAEILFEFMTHQKSQS